MTEPKSGDSPFFLNRWVHDVGHTVHDLERAAVRRLRRNKEGEKKPTHDVSRDKSTN